MQMKRLLIGLACLGLAALTGCNTMRGFGEDISALGRSLSSATGTSSTTH
jgi:predicted small secreted protein